MEGLLLLAAFAALASVGEAFAIGIGFVLDQISPAFSTVTFFVSSAVVLGFAWPIAVRVTKPADE